MTARTAAAVASLALALAVSAVHGHRYEVPIETPIQPKMDVSPFQRVLIAGFLAGGSKTWTPISRRRGCCAASCGRSRS